MRRHGGPGLAMLDGDPPEGAAGGAGDVAGDENPALDVLADLLLAAMEAGRVSDTVELLAALVGERAVRQAHGIAMQRLSDAVGAAAGADAGARPAPGPGPDPVGEIDPSDDTVALLQAIRETTPGKRAPA